jgi:hypothetical protein
MRNRIAGIMHWEHVGIEHAPPTAKKPAAVITRKRESDSTKKAVAAIAAATLLGVAIVLTLRAFFGGPSARA